MRINYNFLRDESALKEIRKHKWIESQKRHYEVGFATAAVDWIKKHGNDWLLYNRNIIVNDEFFSEKRRFRRFSYHLPVQIKIKDNFIFSRTTDINLQGLACRVPQFIQENEQTEVIINFPHINSNKPRPRFQFQSTILRSTMAKDDASPLRHKVFVPFSEPVKNYLRENIEYLND